MFAIDLLSCVVSQAVNGEAYIMLSVFGLYSSLRCSARAKVCCKLVQLGVVGGDL